MSPDPDILDAALSWHTLGYSVLPIRGDGSKQPAVDWKAYQHAQPAAGDVVAWAASHQGIGIACGGPMALEMLEVEGHALDTLGEVAQLVADNDLGDVWARITSGYVERSPRGGFHWYLRTEGPALGNTRIARRRVAPGQVDVLWETRGQGGQTVIAPSGGTTSTDGAWSVVRGTPADIPLITTAERDHLYSVIGMLDQPQTSATRLTGLADQPSSPGLDSALRHAIHGTPASGPTADRPGDDYNARADWADILTGWTRVAPMGSGWTWRRPGKRDGISATTGQATDGVDRLYVFSTSTELDAERPYTKFAAFTALTHGGDYSAASRALRAAGYGRQDQKPAPAAQRLSGTPDATTGQPDAEQAEQSGDDGMPAALAYRIDWAAAYQQDEAAIDWLIDGLVERGRLVSLYSAPKAGKSLLVLDWAAGLATGRGVLGQPPSGELVPVLYCDYENTASDVVDRLRDLGYTDPADLAELHYLSLPSLPPLDTAAGGRELLAAAQAVGAHLVVVDTASRTISGEENAADTWTAWYASTGIALKRAGIALLRLDHSGKDAKKGQRGSSAKAGDVDLVLRLVADGEHLDLIAEERRQSYYLERLSIRRHDDGSRLVHEVRTSVESADDQVAALVAYLDTEGLPADAGRPTVKPYLDERGHHYTKRTLEAALRRRKAGTPNGAGQARQGGRFGAKSGRADGRADGSKETPHERAAKPTAHRLPTDCPPTAQPTARSSSPTAHAAVSLDTGSGQAAGQASLADLIHTCTTDPCTVCRRKVKP